MREVVFVKDNKKRIENIKKKSNNATMRDSTAKKIATLEVGNKILKVATASVGVITAIDFIVPDPVFGLDEAALSALTGLLGYSASVVTNKIEALANGDNAELKMEEITKLTGQLGDVCKKSNKGKANSK